jgi:hypothetical protein
MADMLLQVLLLLTGSALLLFSVNIATRKYVDYLDARMTMTLAKLVEERDRGAITREQFEEISRIDYFAPYY